MKISNSEYSQRLEKFRQKIILADIDAFVLTEEESIYYLTGITYKSLERVFIMVVTSDSSIFIIPKMEESHLKKVINVDHLITYQEYPAPDGLTWKDRLLDNLTEAKNVAVESKSPVEVFLAINSIIKTVDHSHILDELRYIKSETEIALIRNASSYCDYALQLLENTCYYGMSELEVFSIGNTIQRKIIKETDFDYLATSILMAAWPSRISHQAHGIPRVDDRLIEGSHISLAFFRVNGYSAELERTFFTSMPTAEQKNAFQIMMETRDLAYQQLKPGVSCQEVDYLVRQFLENKGLGENIMHRTGHGIGLGNHEGPFLATGDHTKLQENMVISIEPGIYIEGVGGFRHSDTVRITTNGYEILTNAKDQIEDLIYTKRKVLSAIKGALIRRYYNI